MRHSLRIVALLTVLATSVSGCLWSPSDADGRDAREAPELGACRLLTPQDVEGPSNASDAVPCTERHTAQTFVVRSLPPRFARASYDDEAVAGYVYGSCSAAFTAFTGADPSLAMRTVLTWVWFRPSRSVWEDGVHWFRCDVVGGGLQSASYVDLPVTTRDLLAGRPRDDWLVCARGDTVASSEKVPCSRAHDWRAVTTIVLGGADDAYPGDRVVQRRTRSYCSTSVGAWLDYPVDYDYGYSWFGQPEWDAGNRRSVCWSRTST